ncbi:uncharacterized protein LOC62_02G003248 [Vanrija pseudolonga]|uniref:Galactose oxidase-like Early set domain-containing protein n=1 Tax=Vanrija pseudolonga TaxID=143232 RepID=A0AAF0Y478_9TREE|nr:hypothetical protein LOC62_02G003248 [Vanrija pseudolonga]
MLLSTPLSLLAFATLAVAQSSSSNSTGTRSTTSTRNAKSVVHNSTATTTVADAADTLTISGAASTVTFADSVPTGAPGSSSSSGNSTGNGGVLGGNPDDGDTTGFTFPTNASWWVLGAPAKQPNTLQLHFAANTTALRIFLTNSDTSLLKRTLQIKTVLKPADGTTTFTLDTARPLWGAQPGKGFVLVAQFNNAPSVSSQQFELKASGSAPSYPPGYTPSPDNTVYPTHKPSSGRQRVTAGVLAVAGVVAAVVVMV